MRPSGELFMLVMLDRPPRRQTKGPPTCVQAVKSAVKTMRMVVGMSLGGGGWVGFEGSGLG